MSMSDLDPKSRATLPDRSGLVNESMGCLRCDGIAIPAEKTGGRIDAYHRRPGRVRSVKQGADALLFIPRMFYK
jgi:hypothetical protein